MTPTGSEPATFRIEAQCLNQLRHRVAHFYLALSLKMSEAIPRPPHTPSPRADLYFFVTHKHSHTSRTRTSLLQAQNLLRRHGACTAICYKAVDHENAPLSQAGSRSPPGLDPD